MTPSLPPWRRPDERILAAANAAIAPWRWITAPTFLGVHRVPRDRPVLFVGNHTLMGMLDTPLLMLGIVEHTGHFPRSMADDIHFHFPLWRGLLQAFGAVPGSRAACRELMRAGQSILVFPGGGREVFKRRGEAYRLVWGKRAGFARMALEAGYTLVPVASVGAEECYRIVVDHDDLARFGPVRTLLAHAPRKDVGIPPLVRGLAGTPLPIPQRFYFSFGEPVESRPYAGRADAEEAIFALREEVRGALTAEIEALLRYRDGVRGALS